MHDFDVPTKFGQAIVRIAFPLHELPVTIPAPHVDTANESSLVPAEMRINGRTKFLLPALKVIQNSLGKTPLVSPALLDESSDSTLTLTAK
ncbi:GNS1/SUR4 membrane protein [Penicillium concentricum]|uniref:GNS1/SUR4 membrane protein n=1 Tax=Penicillium concentricum TaxID=293559 RepID=A0A9W9VKY3_9EURO|nr:GNS1/SUR4 membrane protein [Penicillium concentricum]KAJ5383486.1 GNS1/SUR4 membrane protein [Penicillium concentricum]